ncbi:hypothetical protein [Alicyclobacillus dauci]|uniref:hypothetical protein n=1 Tax=Alicyclobacillus dauci TaxID=1475485 RepID=UPI00389945B3
MCTRQDCERHIGKWVQFRTPYGYHQGMIERITKDDKVIILSPRRYAPASLITAEVEGDEMQRLDLALAWYGRRPGYPAVGYPGGAVGGYGPGYGYGAWGWSRWAVSFLVIYALLGLWFW